MSQPLPKLSLPKLRLSLLLIFCSLLLSGCSSIKLAYNNLDWLAIWAIEDYVPLDNTQEARLKQALDGHLDWHCRTQLPAYVQWLDAVDTTVAARRFDRERITGHYHGLFTFLERAAAEIAPTAARTLASLEDEQIAELFRNLAERNQDLREEYLEPPLEQQIEQRAERLEERLERWLGDLSTEQQELIEAWAVQRGDRNEAWLAGRQQWQAALAGALQSRQAPGFERQVTLLLTEPNRFTSRENLESAKVQGINLTQHLLAVSSEPQLAQLRSELAAVRDDLQSLVCE